MSSFRQLMMRNKGGGGDIPARYTVVDYVSTPDYGTAYINTGITPTSNTRVVTKIKNNGWQWQNIPVFGCLGVNSCGYYHLTCFNSKWYWGTNGGESNGGSYSTSSGTEYNIDFNNNGKIIINGSTIATGVYTVGNGNLCIARRGGDIDSDIRYGFFKYYSFEVYESGVLVRDFVPVYDTLTSKYGMWDMVSGAFFGNDGNGTISGGND